MNKNVMLLNIDELFGENPSVDIVDSNTHEVLNFDDDRTKKEINNSHNPFSNNHKTTIKVHKEGNNYA